jgi:phosphoglycerol transferase MdoB-like AlkP superfamily enzyme
MQQPFSSLTSRWKTAHAVLRDAPPLRELVRLAPALAFHLSALGVMIWSEIGPLQMAIFVLSWGLANFFWLALIRRPGLSAALSFAILVALVVISRFKFQVLGMTVSFVDVMVIDSNTAAFLGMLFPKVRAIVLIGLAISVPLAILIWRFDPFRVPRRAATLGGAICIFGIAGLSDWKPVVLGEAFGDENYVSHFARSGVEAVAEYAERGFFESDAVAAGALGADDNCRAAGKRPHIILVHDESSFDIRAINSVKIPSGYGNHFRSSDGKARKFLVEGAGGPSWYTEYNVLSGLSSRSYGRFQFFVTRVAAGHVSRGLPRTLERCGYRTHAMYPVTGGFLGSDLFYRGVGVQDFLDGRKIGGDALEPDRFYFDYARRMIEREHGRGPMFLYVYLTANHFPWDRPFHPELTPAGWRNPGNANPEIDEYLRRQAMTERDYADFLVRLAREFPTESFLIVRYGDHQPEFAKFIIDPDVDPDEFARQLMSYDPRYYTTYYAIDAVNFVPADLTSALDSLDAPYLPLVVQEAAGLPLDASFAEQRKILERCNGLFYGCADGAEARRFNRLLINAGLIKGL